MTEIAKAAPAVPGGDSGDLVAIARQTREIKELGQTLLASGLLPDAIRKPEAAVAIMLKGRELGIGPMYALSHIAIIKGRPTLSANLMAALVKRAGHKLRVIESTNEGCTVEGVRADDPRHPERLTFAEADAKRAGLWGQGAWRSYPRALLKARAITALCGSMFADVLSGCVYSPEEMGAEVDEAGEIVHSGDLYELRRKADPAKPDEPADDAEIVEEGPAEPEANTEHEDLLEQVGEAWNALPEEARPDKRKVWGFAKGSEADARKSLERLLKLAEASEEATPAPHPDEVGGVERGGAVKAGDPGRAATLEQIERLESLAAEIVEDGAAKMGEMLGKPLSDLTHEEAEEWLMRLSGRRP